MRNKKLIVLVEIGVSVAIAFVLSQFRLYRGPQGGSVTLQMLPIVLLSIRRGVGPGVMAGAILGTLKLMLDGYVLHLAQVVFDYPLPFALLGLSGLYRTRPVGAVLVGSFGRLLAHTISGALFFGQYAPEGLNPWVYSLGYNASYLIPEFVLVSIILSILARRRDLIDPPRLD